MKTSSALVASIVVVFILLSPVASQADPISYFSDGFESQDFSGGPWVAGDGWEVENAGRGDGYNARAVYPFNSNILLLDRDIDLSTSEDTVLSFYHCTYGTESADHLLVDASGDGGVTWQTVSDLSGDPNRQEYELEMVDLSSFDGESDFRLQFSFSLSAIPEFWRIDDISIMGEQTAKVPEPGTLLLLFPGLAFVTAAARKAGERRKAGE